MADNKPYRQDSNTPNVVCGPGNFWKMYCTQQCDAARVVDLANEAHAAGAAAERAKGAQPTLPEEAPPSPGYVDMPVYFYEGRWRFRWPGAEAHPLTEAPDLAAFMGFVYHNREGKKVRNGWSIMWKDQEDVLCASSDYAGGGATEVRPDAVRLRQA